MPRPDEQASKSNGGCRRKLSKRELILFGSTTVAVIVIIVLLVLDAKKQADFIAKYCNNATCVSEASQITEYIDPDVNPCEDFYQFACGNFLKNAHGDENLALQPSLEAQAKRELFEAYIEPIHDDDHKMVKTAKKVFTACMSTTEIENDKLRTIKEVLRALGGWPVVEGANWNEANFDWVKATYKLRQLGYHYSVFLELKLQRDLADKSKHIFEVEMPYIWDYSSRDFDKIEFMAKIAQSFGATDKETAKKEMADTHQFLTQLQMEVHNRLGLGLPSKFRIRDYQEKCRSINWLEFLNIIAGPGVGINEDQFVVFPQPENLNSWIFLLEATPKRTQANYMIWKVVESTLPYLTYELRNYDNRRKKMKHREDFCLTEIQQRFLPSPMDIICDRKYMPKEKKYAIEEFAASFKTELIEKLKKLSWMEEKDKQKTIEEATAMKIVVVQPENYFDDKILDDLDVDMVETKNSTFLSLLAQITRNYQSTIYNKFNNSARENFYERWYGGNSAGLPVYSEEDNMIYIPAVSTEVLYNENRLNYLNYGSLGTHIAMHMSRVFVKHLTGNTTYFGKNDSWSSSTQEEGQKRLKCIEKEMGPNKQMLNYVNVDFVLSRILGNEISRAAYEKFAENKGEEQHLIRIDYSPRQLLWVSAISTFCQPLNPYGVLPKVFLEQNLFNKAFAGIIRCSAQFGRDFDCPSGSKMNPSNKCSVF